MLYDVLIVGGGPAGLAAALALGRARRRVLLCDLGERRNATATHIHNFVTRDGTPPGEFRRIGQEQLSAYPSVQIRAHRVEAITGQRGAFQVELDGGSARARRILLCVGMRDEMIPLEGFDELWGHAIFQCPYCHGWEIQGRQWGFLVNPKRADHFFLFAMQARAWTDNLVVFTSGQFEVDPAVQAKLSDAGVRLETAPIAKLVSIGSQLSGVQLANGTVVPCEALFAHPPQRHVELVQSLGLALGDDGYVIVDPLRSETSLPGVYAAGDLTTPVQGAILAAAAAVRAATMLNVDMMQELLAHG